MSAIKIFILSFSFMIVLWGGGYVVYTYAALSATSLSPATKSDAIIVLTGGKNRVQDALILLHDGIADDLFISGAHKNVGVSDIETLWQGEGEFPCCVTLGHKAGTTRENAQESRQWIESRNIRTITLVTAHYHMPRAYLEFRALMPDLTIRPYIITPPEFTMSHSRFWSITLAEYHKFLYRRISLFFQGESL